MQKITLLFTILSFILPRVITAQENNSETIISGHIISKGQHIPFVAVSIKGNNIGDVTNNNGHYQLINVPQGKLTVIAQSMGYKTQEKTIEVKLGQTYILNFDFEESKQELDEVIVKGNNKIFKRINTPTIVNSLNPKLFATIQSVTLSESLSCTPGLRMETNCANSGWPQLRMNGMGGEYSQILVNNRPIFKGFSSVFGLEMIPTSILDRVDIRRGGSTIYGAGAVAGTVNLILKDPSYNSFEVGVNTAIIGAGVNNTGGVSEDYSTNFNASLVTNDYKTGITLFGFHRDRKPFDANGDTFSEIPKLNSTTLGARLFHRLSEQSKVTLDFFNLKEDRRGGGDFNIPIIKANMAAAVTHNISTASINYEQYVKEKNLFSVYLTGQTLKADAFRGLRTLYGVFENIREQSYVVGTQYKLKYKDAKVLIGIENSGAKLTDNQILHSETDPTLIGNNTNVVIANQGTNTTSIFSQYDTKWNKFDVSLGARFDSYKVKDREHNSFNKSGNVFSPRITLKYDIKKYLQARVSYSKGYRSPELRDEDFRVEISGSNSIVNKVSEGLDKETSYSYMASLDFNKKIKNTYVGFLLEAFYTQIDNPFATEYSIPNSEGVITATRFNSQQKAKVKGINMELKIIPSDAINFQAGFTIQNSKYDQPQAFNEKRFFRAPNNYGYFMVDWSLSQKWAVSANGNYTGKMLVPHFPKQEVRTSKHFFDLGLKLRHNITLNQTNLQVYTGVKNIFNSYQNDFDRGLNRWPKYIYGPSAPRTVYIGLKFGNLL